MRRLIYFIFASVAVLVFVQCSDWTEMENKFTEPVNINSEDYYRALREYKKTDHPICFGWYSDWSGTGDDMNNPIERYSRFHGFSIFVGRCFQFDRSAEK